MGSEGSGGGGRSPAGSAGPGRGDWALAETRSRPGPGSTGGPVVPQGLAVCGWMWQILIVSVEDVLSPYLWQVL